MKTEKKVALSLMKREEARTTYSNKFDPFIALRINWRVSIMIHLFNVLPGQRILEVGAGDGKFSQALVKATRGKCKVIAAVFSKKYKKNIKEPLKGVDFKTICLESFPGSLENEKFDFIIANHMLEPDSRNIFLKNIKSLIKPGGSVLFFEPNPWNPYMQIRRIVCKVFPFMSKREIEPPPLTRIEIYSVLSEIGFTQIKALPYDFLYSPVPKCLFWLVKNLSIIIENCPYLRNFAGSLVIWARNPLQIGQQQVVADLCEHKGLLGNVSFVIPCHNEEMNILPLTKSINDFFGKYVYEIIIVDDNSSDRTAEVTDELAKKDNRIRVLRRLPPNGVGRALRDGLQAAEGKYILIMDCDFHQIIPEFRVLFDGIAGGADVVIGSRFSRESVLINYAFTKILMNRFFHVLIVLFLNKNCRDISNNLKIFRREVAKNIVIEYDDFAANAETGLKPLLLGYKVVEVPISWINRSIDMGFSTFNLFKTGPNYFRLLVKLVVRRWTNKPYQPQMQKDKQI